MRRMIYQIGRTTRSGHGVGLRLQATRGPSHALKHRGAASSAVAEDASATRARRERQQRDKALRGVKSKCDPYDQAGIALTRAECTRLLTTLDARWHVEDGSSGGVDEDGAGGTAAAAAAGEAPTQSAASGRDAPQWLRATIGCADVDATFALAQQVRVLADNTAHYPASLTVRPYDAEVHLRMHTPALVGLSYEDFMFALKVDLIAADAQTART